MTPDYRPMLATRWPSIFDDSAWWFEVKWDGYRVVVSTDGAGAVRARSRRGIDLLGPFPELARLDLPPRIVLDGEVVAFDDDGLPSFSALQRRTGFGGAGTGARAGINLVAFDVLWDGGELIDDPYEDRRERLFELGLPSVVVLPEATREHGSRLWEAAVEKGLEGVVAKRAGSRYQPGRRSPDWRKIAMRHRIRAVVGGYTAGEGGRSGTFGSILVGLYRPQGLVWIGAVGSGFSGEALKHMQAALDQLERDATPFVNEVPVRATWVEPAIVVNVEYKEWTREARLRAPVFKGVEKMDPETVTWESEGPGT